MLYLVIMASPEGLNLEGWCWWKRAWWEGRKSLSHPCRLWLYCPTSKKAFLRLLSMFIFPSFPIVFKLHENAAPLLIHPAPRTQGRWSDNVYEMKSNGPFFPLHFWDYFVSFLSDLSDSGRRFWGWWLLTVPFEFQATAWYSESTLSSGEPRDPASPGQAWVLTLSELGEVI